MRQMRASYGVSRLAHPGRRSRVASGECPGAAQRVHQRQEDPGRFSGRPTVNSPSPPAFALVR
jgi:hypothetical protein